MQRNKPTRVKLDLAGYYPLPLTVERDAVPVEPPAICGTCYEGEAPEAHTCPPTIIEAYADAGRNRESHVSMAGYLALAPLRVAH